ncbi:hypothetical protein G5714_006440 [Onychostoma macrolepis]|uniref:Uncharacterized protein n=1 Tax=Onychostoma macrolepis TaxID=369639 RepID=A0A7J6D3Y3_9TELE|nr:hypothetical protein G5714_006440 [Onychostoma macrolepis]
MNTVRSAEQCLASAVLRQLSPREAELLKDPSLKCKIRFRFAGPRFHLHLSSRFSTLEEEDTICLAKKSFLPPTRPQQTLAE